jgi:hypothetical protein
MKLPEDVKWIAKKLPARRFVRGEESPTSPIRIQRPPIGPLTLLFQSVAGTTAVTELIVAAMLFVCKAGRARVGAAPAGD